jgi:hypothetical protein
LARLLHGSVIVTLRPGPTRVVTDGYSLRPAGTLRLQLALQSVREIAGSG